ncbi:MAG: HlyC/CorC family transporter [Magnetococcales bacterium]|nr:HlyC/CorC family transporter [Magnetococcales bacterium]MBF0156195.1 HlyC/CorC family transporter [Magnetococcales bacterium]
MDTLTILVLMLFFLLMEGFFSGSEMSVVSADRIKLRHDAAKGSRGAGLAIQMLEKPEWLLSTTLVGTNIAIVSNTSLATLLMVRLFGAENSWLVVPIITPIIWVFGEIVPKSVFQQRADQLTPRIIFVLRAASIIFSPILIIFTSVTKFFARLVGGVGPSPFTLREEIDLMLQLPADRGDIQPMERTMIRRMFSFGEIYARDIAIPLIEVVSIPQNATCGAMAQLAWESGHNKIPVYNGRVDDIVGMVSALDLLWEEGGQSLMPFIKPVRYVPEAKGIEELLMEFRKSGEGMAVVVDEYGAAEGIVTMEDILERVVGEISDEYDVGKPSAQQWLVPLEDGSYRVNPRIGLVTFQEKTGIVLPDGNYETLSGFLLEKARDIPAPGQVIQHENLTFTVKRASKKVIREVILKRG